MPERLKRNVDFGEFLKALTRRGKPRYLPFYEHVASSGFIARRTGTDFDKMNSSHPDYWKIFVDFWLGMGYDCVPMEIGMWRPMPEIVKAETHASEAYVVIRNRQDFDTYEWPDVSKPLHFESFDTVAALLPPGVKIVGGVSMGPYEVASQMMGVMGLSYALADDPGLVSDVFERLGTLYVNSVRQIASMDAVGALRQGDDLGFKTSTFLSPAQLREHVFPIYKAMVEDAHKHGKPFILHSCGNLAEVYDDLIDDCGIDAKHSFEDVILPVDQFKQQYGSRITPLGGLDVDVICRATTDEIRAYTQRKIEQCFTDGHWALGTGNSLTNYMPVENYITVLEEGMKVVG